MYKNIEDLKNGDVFSKKQGAKKEFSKDTYCRSNKAYECTNLEDIGDFTYIKKGKKVYTTD
tara:strand:- start:542 stop:724 length:183 start_codon:yes stop_codon:yes gene_type:complete